MTDTSATASAPVAPAPAPVKPTLLARIKAFFLHSVTILWARFVALVGVVVGFLQGFTPNPTIDNAIHEILQPKLIPWYALGIGVITELARRRTATKTPPGT